ncbi:hypothetical protein [Pelomonas cellulosilytica]|uniref:Transmembrane protein n=1 Tax=Pelomonas cellulosilytica TaxID=2906762 RepID=A0ABS8Y112_9BURK|nr:hypothetical protein [Pelomonas sp. P8]MCE4556633.1 hypothetical protein [Pelomonas sp. P8]
MGLIRFLLRVVILIAGALLGLGLFLFAIVTFMVLVVASLLTGRKPNLQFRMNRNPWAQRRPPSAAAEDVVDIEVREVKDPAPLPLESPLQPPRR